MSLNYQKYPGDDGEATFVVNYSDSDAFASVAQKLQQETETPTPRTTDDGTRDGGPIRRFTGRFSSGLGARHLRRIALQGHEMAEAIRTRRDELYRNNFPVLKSRFETKCTDCGAEYDRDVDECDTCGGTALRDPDPAEKREAERLFESVNREGQSLRDLAKDCEPDQWLSGVSCIVIRYEYRLARGSSLVDDGVIIRTGVDELLRGDPLSLIPVVDEHGRIGGHWYTCPMHRDGPADEPGRCDECGAELRDVYYLEQRPDGDKMYYFRDEVVSWAYPFPRLGGLDGLAPAAEVWVRQVILDMMDRYGAAYYDTTSDSLPNQFMILHTTNPEHWEDQLNKAREDDNPYSSPIFTNSYSPQDASTPEVQVVDAMPDELLGQNAQMKQDYKEDIRRAFGISNAHDSDLEDAGGLNNEGLQLEVTDRSLASQQHDYIEGWLDTLAKRLGVDDWRIEFIPATGPDVDALEKEIRTAALASRAGLDASLEDGKAQIADGEVTVEAGDGGPGQLPSLGEPADAAPTPDDEPDGGSRGGGGGGDTPENPFESAAADQKARDGYAAACDTLLEAYDHIVNAETVEQKAAPFFAKDDDVPKFVLELVDEAIGDGALFNSFDSISTTARGRLANIFREKLQQPQGWSLRSLSADLEDAFDLTASEADTIARAEVKSLADDAREKGYERQGLADDDVFKFIGPVDGRKHAACLWMLGGDDLVAKQTDETPSTGFAGTNPDYGGTPVPLSELKARVKEANERFVDGHDARGYAPHIGCRDTFVQDYS